MTITSAPQGCVPGYLECVCGHAALAIWHPKLGSFCERCERCWAFPLGYRGPQAYRMVATPHPIDALRN